MMSIIGTPFCAPVARRPHYSAEPTLAPLFRLFNDMDMETSHYAPRRRPQQYHRCSAEPTNLSFFDLLEDHFPAHRRDSVAPQPKRRRQSPTRPRRLNPSFAVNHTNDSYELRAELPGIEKENLNIQFTSPRLLQISGRIERPEEEPASKSEEEKQPEVTEPAATATAATAAETSESKRKSKKYQATVEDDTGDDDDSCTEASSTGSWTPVSSPKPEQAKPVATTTEEPKKPAEVKKAASENKKKEAGEQKEKKDKNADRVLVGEFSRHFDFPTDVDLDAVSATLENGHLTVIVPKIRRIRIPVM